MRLKSMQTLVLAASLYALVPTGPALPAQAQAAQTGAANATGVLGREATAPLVPASVFFAGRVASTQERNSAAVRLPGGALVLASLVDTSGYSSDVKERYQAYLITETALSIDGRTLPAGAYGCGFLAGNTFVIMDVGGHDLFTARSIADPELRRPMPLQMMAAPGGTTYRLYSGRSFVTLAPAH